MRNGPSPKATYQVWIWGRIEQYSWQFLLRMQQNAVPLLQTMLQSQASQPPIPCRTPFNYIRFYVDARPSNDLQDFLCVPDAFAVSLVRFLDRPYARIRRRRHTASHNTWPTWILRKGQSRSYALWSYPWRPDLVFRVSRQECLPAACGQV